MDDLKALTIEQLKAEHLDLDRKKQQIRQRMIAVNKELAFRETAHHKAKALAGMTPEEIQRVAELAQTVTGAGGIESPQP